MPEEIPPHMQMDSLAWRLFRNGTSMDRAYELCERAAIIEYDGKTARDQAETMAIMERVCI